jgi:hypothetical protein
MPRHEWLKSNAIFGVKGLKIASVQFPSVIPEIDIWRAANLMLKRQANMKISFTTTKILFQDSTTKHTVSTNLS